MLMLHKNVVEAANYHTYIPSLMNMVALAGEAQGNTL